MISNLKGPKRGKKILIFFFVGILIGFFPIFEIESQEIGLVSKDLNKKTLFLIEGNSLLAISSPIILPAKESWKMRVIVTGYSSTPWETDDTPHLTAAGTQVREGVVANNYLPLGTKIKIPEIFGDKIFVVEDRMSWEKSNYHVDVWFPSYWEALNFGTKKTYIEILGE